MPMRSAQSNFSRGEISDELLARFDVPTYNSALRRARNVIVLKYGGVTKRPGTRIIAEVRDDSEPVRLISFQFDIDQGRALEFGQAYMRPLVNGGVILEPELAITGITNAAKAVVSVANHGYAAGDQVYFIGQAGMDEINGRVVTILSVTTSTYTIDLDTTGFGTWTGNTGGTTNSAPPPAPPAPPAVPTPTPTPPAPPVYGGGYGGKSPYPPDDAPA